MNTRHIKSFNIFDIISLQILVIVLVFLILDRFALTNLYIILGQAHFTLTYLYQARKGKYSLKYIVFYLILLSLAALFSYLHGFYFTIFVATLFIFHNFFDEIRILNIKSTYFRKICILSTVANFISYDFLHVTSNYLKLTLLFLPIFLFIINFSVKKSEFYDWYVSFNGLVIALLLFMGLSTIYIWAEIIVLHYMVWYVKIGKNYFYSENRPAFTVYVREVVLINLLVLLAWFVGKNLPVTIFYDLFFLQNNFLVWTFMHLVVTFRVNELFNSVKE